MPALNFCRFPIDLPQLSTGDNAHFSDHTRQQNCRQQQALFPVLWRCPEPDFARTSYQSQSPPSQLHSVLHQFLLNGVLEIAAILPNRYERRVH